MGGLTLEAHPAASKTTRCCATQRQRRLKLNWILSLADGFLSLRHMTHILGLSTCVGVLQLLPFSPLLLALWDKTKTPPPPHTINHLFCVMWLFLDVFVYYPQVKFPFERDFDSACEKASFPTVFCTNRSPLSSDTSTHLTCKTAELKAAGNHH